MTAEQQPPTVDELDEALRRHLQRRAGTWGVGPVRTRVTTVHVFLATAMFYGAALVVGVLLAIGAGAAEDVGIALIVGSLMAVGGFLTNWWGILHEEHRSTLEETFKPLNDAWIKQYWHLRDPQKSLDLPGASPTETPLNPGTTQTTSTASATATTQEQQAQPRN